LRIATTFTAEKAPRRAAGVAFATLRAGLLSVTQIGGSGATASAASVAGASAGGAGAGLAEAASGSVGSAAGTAACGGGAGAGGEGTDATTVVSGSGAAGVEEGIAGKEASRSAVASRIGCQIGGESLVSFSADGEGADATTMVSGSGAAGVEEGIAGKEASRLAAASRIGCQIGSEPLVSSSAGGGAVEAAATAGAGVDVAAVPDAAFGAPASAGSATCWVLGGPSSPQ
jgi:hypothetical protein